MSGGAREHESLASADVLVTFGGVNPAAVDAAIALGHVYDAAVELDDLAGDVAAHDAELVRALLRLVDRAETAITVLACTSGLDLEALRAEVTRVD
jgi:ethanolamine utilization microcompartment shell protein EutL